jgi:hypothetical protein
MNRRWLVNFLALALATGLSASVGAQMLEGEEEMPPDEFLLPGKPPRPPVRDKKQDRDKLQEQTRDYYQKRELRYRYLERIQEENPERYKQILKIRDLAARYRDTDNEAKKQSLMKELKPLLENELRAQQEDAKKRVADMEKRLDNLKKILKQRDEHWNEVVDFNLKKITGQLDYLEFPPPAVPRQGPPPGQPLPPSEPPAKTPTKK